MTAIRFCTTNSGKLAEARRILNCDIEAIRISLDEIQSLESAAVAAHKARQAHDAIGLPVMVDDTSLDLDALGGFPGALIAWVLKSGGLELVHRLLPENVDAAASTSTAIAYADGKGVEVFTAKLPGHVIAKPRGTNGFGFDSIFVPIGTNKTLAEMTNDEKDAVSPRAGALEHLKNYLLFR